MIALVLEFTRDSAESQSRLNVSMLTSANLTVAPVRAIELADAANVKAGTITSSPGPKPRLRAAKCKADVPEFTARAFCPEAIIPANASSNSFTLAPCAKAPLFKTLSAAILSLRPIFGPPMPTKRDEPATISS